MLNPNNDRLDYGQILSAPDKYKLDFAIGTTYSLDLDALVGVSLALGLSEETDSKIAHNPIALLEALRVTGDKIALFCEAGQIHMPSKVTPLYILLEQMVYQVKTPKTKGIGTYPSFHPKFWLIRYVDDKNNPLYRVIILSRNLTFDRSWDITFCMEGVKNNSGTTKNDPIKDFLTYTLPFAKKNAEKQKKIRQICKELSYVHFDIGAKGFNDFDFIPVGVKKSDGSYYTIKDTPLFSSNYTFNELFVMSPFLSDEIIKGFNDEKRSLSQTDRVLITRAMSLSSLKPENCDKFRIYTVKDSVIDGESIVSEEDNNIQKQDIHAKVFMLRKYSDSELYLGSLNASRNAIIGNIEFVIRLKAKNRYLNLTKLTEDLFCGNEENPNNPFQLVDMNKVAKAEAEPEQLLSAIIKDVTRLKATAKVIPNGEVQEYLAELEVAMMDWAFGAWESYRDWYEQEVVACNNTSNGSYLPYMLEATERGLNDVNAEGETLLSKVIEMCLSVRANGMKRTNNNSAIGGLRVLYSKISLDKLEPDLVIMDEFQRFKYLINSDPESETGMLARKFFGSNNVRMLLLSATPYKMYSTLEEIDDSQVDEHYSEFLDVMGFLNNGEGEQEAFKSVWNNYSVKLKELSSGDATLLFAKSEAEEAMYGKVCRTERVSAAENADIIDDSSVKVPVDVLEQDVVAYISAQKLLDEIGASYHVPVDYIKSTPYLMTFMRDYQLKRNIEKYFKLKPAEVGKVNKPALWINKNKLDLYEQIPSGNARLEVLKKHAFAKNSEMLLWVPPSLPYYEPRGAYKDAEHFSKVLVFSSWEMVPRMIAGMISYEAERKSVGKLAKKIGEDVRYFYTEDASANAKRRRFPLPRLNFAVNDDQPNAMSLFCLIYPSEFLTNCYDPIECLNEGLSLREIESRIKAIIKEALNQFKTTEEGVVDKRWYYYAPMLLDSETYFDAWSDKIGSLSETEDSEGGNKKKIGFMKHVLALLKLRLDLISNADSLGKMPEDLQEV